MIFGQTPVDLASNWNQGVAIGVLTFTGGCIAWMLHRAFGTNGFVTKHSQVSSEALEANSKTLDRQADILNGLRESAAVQLANCVKQAALTGGIGEITAQLIAGALAACDVIDEAAPDCKEKVEVIRKRLRGD